MCLFAHFRHIELLVSLLSPHAHRSRLSGFLGTFSPPVIPHIAPALALDVFPVCLEFSRNAIHGTYMSLANNLPR